MDRHKEASILTDQRSNVFIVEFLKHAEDNKRDFSFKK